jgi:hypothetical protein
MIGKDNRPSDRGTLQSDRGLGLRDQSTLILPSQYFCRIGSPVLVGSQEFAKVTNHLLVVGRLAGKLPDDQAAN